MSHTVFSSSFGSPDKRVSGNGQLVVEPEERFPDYPEEEPYFCEHDSDIMPEDYLLGHLIE